MTSPAPSSYPPIGVDIGGTGVKGGVVDLAIGDLIGERVRVETPQPATPAAVADVVAEVIGGLGASGPVGLTVPAVVMHGVVRTAANIDEAWIGTDAEALFRERLGVDCLVLNDADAAGLAEVRFGAGKGRDGVVLVVTLGTGIGSGLFVDGTLVPNSELGHIQLKGRDAEEFAAESVREVDDLSWKKWGRRVGTYLRHLDALFSPELFIIGGGVSKKFDRYTDYLEVDTEVVPATLQNQAGIVGAALALSEARAPSPLPPPLPPHLPAFPPPAPRGV